jgi:hypothetical protein
MRLCILTGAVGLLGLMNARADQLFNGTLYYTNFTGGQNVNKITYSYDQPGKAICVTPPSPPVMLVVVP